LSYRLEQRHKLEQMMVDISRRNMMASVVAAASALPLRAVAAPMSGFTHGVASGDPLTTRIILWTRFVSDAPQSVAWEVARDAAFTQVVRRGKASTSAARDYTIKVDADGLPENTQLYYRFRSGDQLSAVGRTRTLPRGKVDSLKLALFSCANLPFGYFNAYKHCATRTDIDVVVHVGDYIYEYKRGSYPSAREAMADRVIEPAGEVVHLQDYRQRYQSYRSDADLQALHAAFPMICIWDDHEFSNDAWKDGAENHQPETEGSWTDRWHAAIRAYDEWLPVRSSKSPVHYRSFQWGTLASLIVMDTRFIGRDKQLNYRTDLRALSAVPRPEELAAAVKDFKPRWLDPKRSILGAAQEAWLTRQLQRSKAQGTTWQVLTQQIQFGFFKQSKGNEDFLKKDAADFIRSRVALGSLVADHGLPSNLDSWSGYPAARERLMATVKAHANNAIMLGGDTHNGWAFEMPGGDAGNPLFVEIGGHSVSSPGVESSFERLEALAALMYAANPELKWAQLQGRGYTTVTFTTAGAEAQWLFVDTIRDRNFQIASTKTARVTPTTGVGVSPFVWS
jgi:alkaline phosphatase D